MAHDRARPSRRPPAPQLGGDDHGVRLRDHPRLGRVARRRRPARPHRGRLRGVRRHRAARTPTRPHELPEDRVHCDYYWITDGIGPDEEVVGFLALRHSLTAWLLEEGGHIGYSVRPSRRARGPRLAGARPRRTPRRRARPRSGAGDLRRRQRRLGAHHRAQRRGLRGHPQRQAPLLDRHRATPGSVVHELRTEEPQHPHEVVRVDHRRVDGERRPCRDAGTAPSSRGGRADRAPRTSCTGSTGRR